MQFLGGIATLQSYVCYVACLVLTSASRHNCVMKVGVGVLLFSSETV